MEHEVEFIYHATFVSDATIEALEKVKHKHYVSPAFGLRYNTLYEAADFGIDQDEAECMGNKAEFDACIETMTKMHEAGIKVLPFGDYGFAWVPIGTDTRDFEHFQNYFGFSSWEVLRAATAYGGEAYGGDNMGQVAPGFLADLIMIDGDPLADLTLFQDRDRILMIMKDGRYHKEPQPRQDRQSVAAE
jgi:imidazolonepropionase-like amidohydrolase